MPSLSILNQNQIMKRKSQILVSAFLIICATGLIFSIFFQIFTTRVEDKGLAKINYSKDMFASGLSFTEFKDTQKTFSLKANTIEISKKKIGFLRMGFFKAAKINGLKINLYFNPDGEKSIEDSIDFEQYLLNNESIKTLRLNNIKELKIEDIEINFFQNEQRVSSIKSDQASIAFYTKDFIFSGNVSIFSGNEKILQSQSLRWINEKKQFITTDAYQLKTDAFLFEGKGMSCDYMLDDIHFLSEPKKYVLPKN